MPNKKIKHLRKKNPRLRTSAIMIKNKDFENPKLKEIAEKYKYGVSDLQVEKICNDDFFINKLLGNMK